MIIYLGREQHRCIRLKSMVATCGFAGPWYAVLKKPKRRVSKNKKHTPQKQARKPSTKRYFQTMGLSSFVRRAQTTRPRVPIMPKRENGVAIHTRSVVAKREDMSPSECEPSALLCPITHEMFRDPVVVIASGHTYERSAILRHFYIRDTDPCTNAVVRDKMVVQNVQTRKCVQQWLDSNPGRTPKGWESREVPSPGFEFKLDDGDVKTLRAIRQYCSLFDLWTDGQYPGEWQGVRVESSRVVNLDLSMKQIHSFPESIVNLTALKMLDLSSNYLTRLPESIGKLTSLDVLDLRNNKLTEIPLSIGNLASLGTLGLDNNEIVSLPPSIGSLASLENFDFDRNKLTAIPESIGDLTKLTRLSCHGNQLATVPNSIGKLASLNVLCLSCNNLINLPDSIGNLTSLEFLNLDNNAVSDIPESIGNLDKLMELSICDNKLRQLPETLHKLCSLRSLCVCDNKIGRLPTSLGRLSSLESMFLPNNQLTTLPSSVGNLAGLKKLDLRGNALTRVPRSMSNLTDLKVLHVCDTELCRECVPELLRPITKFHKISGKFLSRSS